MSKLKVGMYVKLREDNACGCEHCEKASSGFHRILHISEDSLRLEGIYGSFSVDFDFDVKKIQMENK